MSKPKANGAKAAPSKSAVIRCPAKDAESAPPCKETVTVAFDVDGGVWRGSCKKHTELSVCPGSLFEALKVK